MKKDETRLLHREIVEARTGLSRSSLYRQMRAGLFPKPLRVGARAVRWREDEINAWLETRERSHGAAADRDERAG